MSLIVRLLALYTRVRYCLSPRIVIGKGARVYPSTSISLRYNRGGGGVCIGRNSRIGVTKSYRIGIWHPTHLSARADGARIVLGDCGNMSCANICAKSLITIGDHFEIGGGVHITDFNGHPTYSLDRTQGEDRPQPIHIGNNVWIGFNAIILKGTTIGDNSIVAAGSVVKGTFPPNSIIMGNPAHVVKTLDISRCDNASHQ